MYLDEIGIGEIIPNYSKLCELLHEPMFQGGNQKKTQLKDFERYFSYEKIGHKFIITDIYDEPLEKEDKRNKGGNSIYIKFIEAILLRHLVKQDGYTCTLRKIQLLELLGMVNKQYQKLETEELQKIDSRMTSFEVNHFYQRCNQKLDRILFTALNNLKSRCLLSYREEIMIVTKDSYEPLLATDLDISRIDNVKNKVLAKMGLANMQQVFCRFKNKEFYGEVNSKLNELYGWKYTYKQYVLIFTSENCKEALTQIDIDLEKLTFNGKVVDVINKQAESNKDKQVTKSVESKAIQLGVLKQEDATYKMKNLDVFEYPYCYIEIQQMLADKLLNIGYKKFQEFSLYNIQYDNFNDTELDELFDGKTVFDK